MGKRDYLLLVAFDLEDVPVLQEWKEECLKIERHGGIKKRTTELIKEDLKRIRGKT